MKEITTVELRDRLADVLNTVLYAKTQIIVTRRDRPIAVISPVGDLVKDRDNWRDLKISKGDK